MADESGAGTRATCRSAPGLSRNGAAASPDSGDPARGRYIRGLGGCTIDSSATMRATSSS